MLEEINYQIKQNSRSRCIRILIRPDGKVTVTAPKRVSKKEIIRFVESKMDWIKQKIVYLQENKNNNQLVPQGSRREYNQYKARAKKVAMEKIKEINSIYNFDFARVSIKFQRTRWGSCSRNKNLNFNYRIVFLPDHLANYLVAHELCHLKELNHSKKFWDLVSMAIPDYRQKSRELKMVS